MTILINTIPNEISISYETIKSWAIIMMVIGIASLLIARSLYRSQDIPKDQLAKRRKVAKMFNIEQKEKDNDNDPYSYRFVVGALIACGILQFTFGSYFFYNYSIHYDRVNLAIQSNTFPEFIALEYSRINKIITMYNLFTSIEKLFGLSGFLIAILRYRVPRVWVYFGIGLAVECAIACIVDSYFLGQMNIYFSYVNESIVKFGIQELIKY